MEIYTPQNACFEALVSALVDTLTLRGELDLIANRDRSNVELSEEEWNTPVITKELRDRLISNIERKQATEAEKFFFFNANGDRCYINDNIYETGLQRIRDVSIAHSSPMYAVIDPASGIELTEVNDSVTHRYPNITLPVFEKVHRLSMIRPS